MGLAEIYSVSMWQNKIVISYKKNIIDHPADTLMPNNFTWLIIITCKSPSESFSLILVEVTCRMADFSHPAAPLNPWVPIRETAMAEMVGREPINCGYTLIKRSWWCVLHIGDSLKKFWPLCFPWLSPETVPVQVVKLSSRSRWEISQSTMALSPWVIVIPVI